MSQDDFTKTIIYLAVGLGLVITWFTYPIRDKIKLFLGNLWQIFNILLFPIVFGLILTLILIYILFKSLRISTKKIFNKIENVKALQREKDNVENILNGKLEYDEQKLNNETEALRYYIKKVKKNIKLRPFNLQLKKRLAKAVELLEEIKRDKRVADRKSKLIQIEKEIREKDEENRIRSTYDESNRDWILYMLKANEKNVFIKKGLSKKQIDALEKKGFKQINEYSVKENKFIRFLVKPKLNHSRTHTFLVWDTIRLLKEIVDVKNIQEHNTVDADITFTFRNKKYALEIETGTLLEKKKQAQGKVEDLNRKYPKRWMFIVSNKNLLPKYNKLGFTSSRKQVSENLKRLLKN